MPDGLRPPYDVGDGRTCSCMLAALPLVEYRFAEAGWIQQDFAGMVFQWSGRSDVSASANTHRSGAVFDVAASLVNTDAKQRVWQQCGFTPFHRFPPKFSAHGHNLVNGCPHLDPSAAYQIRAYRNGRDGLVSNGPYPGPTDVPYRTWQRAQVLYADLIKEMLMDPADIWNYDIDPKGNHSAKFYVESTREGVGIIGRRTSAIDDKVDKVLAVVSATAAAQKALVAQVKQLTDAQAETRADVADLTAALAAPEAAQPTEEPEE